MKALSICAEVGSKNVLLKPGAQQRDCSGCGTRIWVSPTTLAMGEDNITLVCNACGKAVVARQAAEGHPMALRYTGLADGTPDDERRKRELEAHGFKAATADEIEDIRGT